MKPYALIVFVFLFRGIIICDAQSISPETEKNFTDYYGQKEHYKLVMVIEPIMPKDDLLPSGDVLYCHSNSDLLVVAIFAEKPKEMFGRLLVSKKYNGKTERDEHNFQDIVRYGTNEEYFALLNVQFPREANHLNCQSTLQVFDRKNLKNKIRLLVFEK